MFNPSYCAFEVIILMRIAFFLSFNVISCYCLCFEIDEQKYKLLQGQKIINQQNRITLILQALYNRQSRIGDLNLFDINIELGKPEVQ